MEGKIHQKKRNIQLKDSRPKRISIDAFIQTIREERKKTTQKLNNDKNVYIDS